MKSKNEQITTTDIVASEIAIETKDTGASEIASEQLVKRGRGRPKKVSTVIENPQKIKKVGRPRKLKEEIQNEEILNIPKRSRGRPKKDIVSTPKMDKMDKRGRGRPKKEIVYPSIEEKRGRGRPRKNLLVDLEREDFDPKDIKPKDYSKDYSEMEEKLYKIKEVTEEITNEITKRQIYEESKNIQPKIKVIILDIEGQRFENMIFELDEQGEIVLKLKSEKEVDVKYFVKDVKTYLGLLDKNTSTKGYINKIEVSSLDCFLNILGIEERNTELYNWFYNLILLNFYNTLKQAEKLELGNEDFRVDLSYLINNVYLRLHPLIKTKLTKPGISIIFNNTVGFDTEYKIKQEEKHKNEIISIQIALNIQPIIRLPVITPFQLGTIHTLTSEIYTKKDEHKNDNFVWLESNICKIINLIREEYKEYTNYLEQLERNLSERDLIQIDVLEKQQIYYLFPVSKEITKFKFVERYSFKELLRDIKEISKSLQEDLFKEISVPIGLELNETKISKFNKQSVCRMLKTITSNVGISTTITKNTYLCCHLTNADLSVLDDFEELKHELDIVHKNFITLGRPLIKEGLKIYIRDTSLLAPMGHKSLDSVGEIYGEEYRKINLPSEYRGNMEKLKLDNEGLFIEYAMRDAKITLKHANEMSKFYNNVNKIGVPITLSSIGKQYVLKQWNKDKYTYQITPQYLIGDVQKVMTPQGLDHLKEAGVLLSQYIANYKGGRNESFMYGYDKNTEWFDYDLTSAYTTSMSYLGHPNYYKATVLNPEEPCLRNEIFLMTNYIILSVDFNFPEDTKYPSIPCYIDKNTTVYPLKGSSKITGIEYLFAKYSQNCSMEVKYAVSIPFKLTDEDKREIDDIWSIKELTYKKPYYHIIKELQEKRKSYKEKTLNNILYKEMSNSIYGNVVRGISNKRLFDIKTGGMITLGGNELSNPILGCYITALVRTVIAETLHNINRLGGKVVSVTTDGFITNLNNLEDELMKLPSVFTKFFRLYRSLRGNLGFVEKAYELKNKGKGIISWCTRGQLGIESGIKATTGFQTQDFNKKDIIETFLTVMESKEKHFEFIQQSLRGGNEIYKKGGHVTMIYKERKYNLLYDNRRKIKESEGVLGETLLDSLPLSNIKEGVTLRVIGKMFTNVAYNKNSKREVSKTYKTALDSAIRTFLKGLISEEPMFGLEEHREEFKEYKDIIKFIKEFDSSKSISKSSISHLKSRKLIWKNVTGTPEVQEFVDYVKRKLPSFKVEEFLKFKSLPKELKQK